MNKKYKVIKKKMELRLIDKKHNIEFNFRRERLDLNKSLMFVEVTVGKITVISSFPGDNIVNELPESVIDNLHKFKVSESIIEELKIVFHNFNQYIPFAQRAKEKNKIL